MDNQEKIAMRGDGMGGPPRPENPSDLPDRELWRHSRAIDASDDAAARYLDLAGFAEDLLDPDDRERVAEQLRRDPDAAADIAAARALADAARHPALPEAVIASARALRDPRASQSGGVVPFAPPGRTQPQLHAAMRWGAQWASLAAAIVVAAWLGFTLGVDTSGAFSQDTAAAEDSFLNELIDPSANLTRDPTEGARS
jgi:hypothetical protein